MVPGIPQRLLPMFIITCLAASCSVGRAARSELQPDGPGSRTAGAGGKMVRLTFRRSGGFAAVKVEGTVLLSEHGARLSANENRYHRDLSPSEIKEITGLADPAELQNLKVKMGPAAYPAPDQYQYDFAIELSDGRSYSASVPEGQPEELEKFIHGLGDLVEWMSKECNRIQEEKVRE